MRGGLNSSGLLVLCGLLLVQPARAGLFDDDIARERVERLRRETQEQLADVTRRFDEVQRNQLDFAGQLETIKADIAKLRGQLEELNYNLEATQKRQKDFYLDLDTRLRKLESAPVSESEAAPAAAKAAADPNAEARDYEAAVVTLKAGKFKEAGSAFQAFIQHYPDSTMLPSAYFWAGFAFVRNRDYARGAELYGKLASGWPTDAKAADALGEQAAALEMAGDKVGAKRTADILLNKYPESEAARRLRPASKKK